MPRTLICFLLCLSSITLPGGEAPDPAIAFLIQRQETDGSWSDRTHHLIAPAIPEDQDGSTRSAVFTTGLVLRALIATRHDPRQDQTVSTAIQRGTEYLSRLQQEDGEISSDAGDHGVATHALRLVHDAGMLPGIGPRVERAVKHLVAKQRVRLGWSRNDQDPQRIDLWTGFWCLQALEGAGTLKSSSTPLFSGWWDVIAKAAKQERPDGGFPASFIMSPDGSWSLDPMAPDASAAALFQGEHPLSESDYQIVTAMRNRLLASAEADRNAGIDWPRRLALSGIQRPDPRKPWPWTDSFASEMANDGPTAGSWPATGNAVGRISATAFAVILQRQLDEQRVFDQVTQALAFFHQHANADGGWSDRLADGEVQSSSISTTSLVVLSFLGAGYDHKTPNRFKKSVEAGLLYLRNIPDADRLSTVELAMVTVALAEAYAMTNDPNLRMISNLHLLRLLSRRTDLPGAATLIGAWGADHLKPGFQHDTWTTMWCVMAMKSGQAGGLLISDGLERTGRWLDHMTGRRAAGEPLHFPAQCRWGPAGLHQYEGQAEAAALWIAMLTSHKADGPVVQDLAGAVLAGELPRWKSRDYDLGHAYVTMVGLFQVGGPGWETARMIWPRSMPTLDSGEALSGSVANGQKANGATLGRITATAYVTMANEVLYRYRHAIARE